MLIISRWRSYQGPFDRENDGKCLIWGLYAGGALMKVADLAISTVCSYMYIHDPGACILESQRQCRLLVQEHSVQKQVFILKAINMSSI